jgi:hypothetical protein
MPIYLWPNRTDSWHLTATEDHIQEMHTMPRCAAMRTEPIDPYEVENTYDDEPNGTGRLYTRDAYDAAAHHRDEN